MTGLGRNTIEEALAAHAKALGIAEAVELTGAAVAPLVAIDAHAHADHWHFVTLGLSELGAKVSDDPARSGWGHELTLRAPSNRDAPPRWPARVLRQLAAYVVESRNPFGIGHHMDLGGPLDSEAPAFGAIAFAADPELGAIDTPNGALRFLQVVPLHANELRQAGAGSVKRLLDALAARDPLLVSRADRASVAGDPAFAEAFTRSDEPAAIITATLAWRRRGLLRPHVEVSMGPAAVVRRQLPPLLERLIEDGRAIRIYGEGRVLEMRAGGATRWCDGSERLELTLSPEAAEALCALLTTAKDELNLPGHPDLILRLVP